MTSEQRPHDRELKDQIVEMLGRTGLDKDQVSTELSMRRTGISFQRTRMSADRTLMSVIRTSLSLISFGFTIFQFFRSLREAGSATETAAATARNFGIILIITGIGMLILGLGFHVSFMKALRDERTNLVTSGLLHGDLPYPISLTMIVAFILLGVGLLTLAGIFLRAGPFQ